MRITNRSPSILVLAGAVSLLASGTAYAQQSGSSDALSHMAQPRADGQCWISTQKPVMENGYGYWGPCANTTGSAAAMPAAHRARAQANRSEQGQD
jgi:hypothetical protein